MCPKCLCHCFCVCVCVQSVGIIVQKGAVQAETPAFVDERKSPPIVGRFYPRCLTAVGSVPTIQTSSEGNTPQTLIMLQGYVSQNFLQVNTNADKPDMQKRQAQVLHKRCSVLRTMLCCCDVACQGKGKQQPKPDCDGSSKVIYLRSTIKQRVR